MVGRGSQHFEAQSEMYKKKSKLDNMYIDTHTISIGIEYLYVMVKLTVNHGDRDIKTSL